MKQWIKLSVPAVAVGLIGLSANALPISGNITFAGKVALDASTAEGSTGVTGWSGLSIPGGLPQVESHDGSFDGFVTDGDGVTFSAPWTYATPSPIANFWTVDGFSFELDSATVTYGPNSVTVNGIGKLSGNGFDVTGGDWTFTTQDPGAGTPARFSFSASDESLPDGGTTVMLLGAALTGLGMIKRKLA